MHDAGVLAGDVMADEDVVAFVAPELVAEMAYRVPLLDDTYAPGASAARAIENAAASVARDLYMLTGGKVMCEEDNVRTYPASYIELPLNAACVWHGS